MSERRRHRLDSNHHDLRKVAETVGWMWLDTAQTGLGFDAILVGRRIVFAEIKDGNKPISAQQLTPHEERVHDQLRAHGVTVEILTCPEDVLMLDRGSVYRREG